MTDKLTLRLFGPPQIIVDEVPLKEPLLSKAQAILYYLAATGRPQSRTTLAGLLWGDMTEDTARTNLRKALADLRQALADFVLIDRQTVSLRTERRIQIDVVEFLDKIKLTAETVDFEALEEAIGLYQGDFLAGFYVRNAPDFESWLYTEQARLREMVVQALHLLSGHYAQLGDTTRGIGYVRQLLALEPWREEAHRHLMDLLAQAGQRGAALAQYEICRQVLAEELGVEPGAETIALYERIRQGELVSSASAAPRRTAAPPPTVPRHNLPAQPTAFIGRKQALNEIIRRLSEPDCRLLTLVGPGGIGKTRLALQVAQLLFEARANQIDITHGVFFVSLTPIETTGEVVATVAEALSFSFYSHVPPRQQLLDYLRDKRLLLVLDNFEHLLNPTSAGAGDAVQLLSEICAAAPGVTTLVTSREALNIQEAWFHPITEMAFPTEQESGSETASAALLDYDAVQLFMQGAQRARVKFSLADEKDAVLKICRLVGGVPLGIELAASWLKVLPATKIASEIERSLDILSTRLQNLPERHRSMRAVLAYSWQRLTPAEQLVLQRLSVFRGSFTETAAEEVAGASLLTLATLVEKSLLQVRENTRYGMHELLRQFAENQLQASPQEALTARQQHSTYFLEFLQSQQQWFFGTKQKLALAEIAAEIENIRTAWHWAVSQAYLAVLDQAVSSLFQFYELRSRFQEGEELFGEAISQLQQVDLLKANPAYEPILGKLQARQVALRIPIGHDETAQSTLTDCLKRANQPAEEVFILNQLGEVALSEGNRPAAINYLRKSLKISQTLNDLVSVIASRQRLIVAVMSGGDYEESYQLAVENLAMIRQLGSPNLLVRLLHSLGWITNSLGRYQEAEAYWRESLTLHKEIDSQVDIGLTFSHLGWSAWCAGGDRLQAALDYGQQALAIFEAVGHQSHLAMTFADLALYHIDAKNPNQTYQYAQQGLVIARQINNKDYLAYNLYTLGMAEIEAGRTAMGWAHLLEGLQTAWEADILAHVLTISYWFAKLLSDESQKPDLGKTLSQEKQRQALEILVVGLQSPFWWAIIRTRAIDLKARLTAALPPEIVLEIESQAQGRRLADLVRDLLQSSASTP